MGSGDLNDNHCSVLVYSALPIRSAFLSLRCRVSPRTSVLGLLLIAQDAPGMRAAQIHTGGPRSIHDVLESLRDVVADEGMDGVGE